MIVEYNLQFFGSDGPGGEKTEEPTSKRKSDTRKDGKVPKSKELSNGVELIALFLILKFWVGRMGENFMKLFGEIYEKMPAYTTYWEGNIVRRDYSVLINNVLLELLKQLLPFFIVGLVITLHDAVQVPDYNKTFETQIQQAESDIRHEAAFFSGKARRAAEIYCQDYTDHGDCIYDGEGRLGLSGSVLRNAAQSGD